MQKILFYYKFIKRLYMFRALRAHHQVVKIVYTASGIIAPVGGQVKGRLLSTCAPNGHLQSVTIPDAV